MIIFLQTIKKTLRFQKYLNRAALAEHGVEKCVDDLASQLTDSRDVNLQLVVDKLHFTEYLKELKENPTAFEKCKYR